MPNLFIHYEQLNDNLEKDSLDSKKREEMENVPGI